MRNQPGSPVDTAALEESIQRHARYSLGKAWHDLSARDRFAAVALAVRDRMVDLSFATEERYRQKDAKRLYYLSIEFLIGQSLANNLRNLGLRESCQQALGHLGADLDEIEESEPDAALGNGGLGRLAACFLDSLATLGMPGYGYGIDYEYGLFKQEIDNGYQREKPDNWLAQSSPWQIARPDEACVIPVYGRIEHSVDRKGGYNPMWMDWRVLIGMPYDMLIPGYGGRTVNFLRLYSARSSHDFDMGIFNDGDYFKAVEQKIASETISKVLYPSDAVVAGQELRLVQEYFLVACTLRDIVARFEQSHTSYRDFSAKVAIQLNDTHPALAVAELMRILVDEKNIAWEEAWEITQATLAYTNHTLLPEALEKWPVPLLEHVLPRHLQIIVEINRRFLEQVTPAFPGDTGRLARMSLIEESTPQQVRMANLAIVGSHSINGVSAIHTRLLETALVPDFYSLWPERFNNKTNGITQRRWLLKANPGLAELISSAIGDAWITDLDRLREIERSAGDVGFQDEFGKVKRANKERLARIIRETSRVKCDPDSLFDVQVKRIHAYKRQLLNVMHIIDEYLSLIEDGRQPAGPAHVRLRRQSRARLLGGETNHQADPQRGPRHQQRCARQPLDQGGFHPGLPRFAGRKNHSRCRSERTDLHGGKGSVRNRQHEIRAERRAYDRHAGRRQHRDPGGGRRGEHLHLRAEGRRCAGDAPRPVLSPPRILRPRSPHPARGRCLPFKSVLPAGAGSIRLDLPSSPRRERRVFPPRGPGRLRGSARKSRRGVPGPCAMDTHGDSERCAHGQVLQRPHGPGVRPRYMGAV